MVKINRHAKTSFLSIEMIEEKSFCFVKFMVAFNVPINIQQTSQIGDKNIHRDFYTKILFFVLILTVRPFIFFTSTFINRALTHLPSINFQTFFASYYLFFLILKTLVPKLSLHAFPNFGSPLSDVGPNQLAKTPKI